MSFRNKSCKNVIVVLLMPSRICCSIYIRMNNSDTIIYASQRVPPPFHTSISSYSEVPSLRNGLTISSLTGKFCGSVVQRLIVVGFIPFKNWYPKNSSSIQCFFMYSIKRRKKVTKTSHNDV